MAGGRIFSNYIVQKQSCVFYSENTLDKLLSRKKSWKSMPVSMDTVISNSMLMMASQVRPSTAQAFSR